MIALRLVAVTVAVSAIPIPPGVMITDMYPHIDYWYGEDFRPNPLCEKPRFPGAPDSEPLEPVAKASAYPFRRSLGLRQLARDLMTSYNATYATASISDIKYQAGMRRKRFDWLSVRNNAAASAIANVHDGVPGGVADEICAAFGTATRPEQFCHAQSNFSAITQCMTNYEYQDSQKLKSDLSPSSDFGWKIDPTCLRGLTPGRSPLLFQLQQFEFLPDTIDRATAYSEAKTYMMAWKALDHLERYAEYKLIEAQENMGKTRTLSELIVDPTIFKEILPEWTVDRVFYMSQIPRANEAAIRLPFAVIAKHDRDLLIVLRKPITTYEARLGSFNQHTFNYLYNFTGALHDGAGTVRSSMGGSLIDYLREYFIAIRDDTHVPVYPDTVTLVGGHLPSAGAVIGLAHDAAMLRENILGKVPHLNLQSITFGNRYHGTSELVEYLRSRVNMRHLVTEGDTAEPFPCKTTYGCDERISIARTGTDTGSRWPYAPTPGYYALRIEELRRINKFWADRSTILQVAALHDCAYACILANRACPEDQASELCDPSKCESFISV